MGIEILVIGSLPVIKNVQIILNRSSYKVLLANVFDFEKNIDRLKFPSIIIFCDDKLDVLGEIIIPKLLILDQSIPVLIYSKNKLPELLNYMYPLELMECFFEPVREFEFLALINQLFVLSQNTADFRKLISKTRKTIHELDLFRKIDRSVIEDSENKKILYEILEKITGFIKADAWSLLLYNEKSKKLIFEISKGSVGKKVKNFSLELGQGIAGWVAQYRVPLIVPDALKDKRFFKGVDLVTNFETESVLATPLIVRGKLVGVIELVTRKGGKPFDDNDLMVLQAISTHIAITLETLMLYETTKILSNTDQLTGLYNARFLRNTLESELQIAKQKNTHISFIFMDLDYFKNVNDQYGHLRGRKVLKEVAKVIEDEARENDIIARYGGDEFVIVLPGTGSETAMDIAEKIRLKIKKVSFLKEEKLNINITASFGIATFPENAQTLDDLIEVADSAMFSAKRNNRDAVYMAGLGSLPKGTV
ncbi:MAG: hypothetical protein A2161_05635 [Candidatus Schekmanbacteria bacterium RBG_13_48_7]|uniref:GGDEF domain-containing protein n=1 Tax=Candidatus Schekmanbacteria bacterium RBG_13_48_7 TaxID=1817878 RepID=A0A1F7S4S5_9BACT|nr:MAG: hypothetical protein A2161_05635 [Candidatus Schekmanbacteria bacterium RBG_13_48_7]